MKNYEDLCGQIFSNFVQLKQTLDQDKFFAPVIQVVPVISDRPWIYDAVKQQVITYTSANHTYYGLGVGVLLAHAEDLSRILSRVNTFLENFTDVQGLTKLSEIHTRSLAMRVAGILKNGNFNKTNLMYGELTEDESKTDFATCPCYIEEYDLLKIEQDGGDVITPSLLIQGMSDMFQLLGELFNLEGEFFQLVQSIHTSSGFVGVVVNELGKIEQMVGQLSLSVKEDMTTISRKI
ncbi:hypothetical protein [Vibrio sp. D431a]|uniref:hypothetical protein n=1 Tax=Vibrio sp. D431a TaxID=2837388 RepID=UPI0025550612|nr:hypothetical protein [Vibrio sp. D431a]MDK9789856.1 hypothetical protein [Vibrio sp. D431a]